MYKGKKVLILGLARTGYSVAKLLSKCGANITINDFGEQQNPEIVSELEELGIELILGSHPVNLLDNGYNLIVKNPGIPLSHIYIKQAKEKKIEVTTEIEIAYNLMNDAKYIAITGTNGKTTTATLIHEILKKSGLDSHLVGNIGNPISNYYDSYTSETIFVLEISAQQLYDCKNFKADISILTNLSEAHLEFFESVQEYYAMKKKVFNNMFDTDVAIINGDCTESLELTYNINPQKKYFSIKENVDGGYLHNDKLYVDDIVIDTSEISLLGKHNYQNVLSAILCVKQFDVNESDIKDVLKSFKGVHHRLEYVRSVNGVKYYNDSKSTNIDSCIVALNAIKESTILILGGLERGQNFEELLPHLNYVSRIYCYGETRDRIKSCIEKFKIECVVCNDLQEAVVKAHDYSNVGNVILFSPACASWDQFDNFESRGDIFKLIVNSFTN